MDTATASGMPESPSPTGTVPPRLREHVIRGGTLFLASRLAAQTFQWLITFYVASLLHPSDYGLLAIATVVVNLTDLFVEAGFGRALVQKLNLTKDDIGQAFFMSIVLSVVGYTLLWMATPLIAGYLNEPELTTFLRVFSLAIFLTPLQSICLAQLERDVQLKKQSLVNVAVAVLQSLFVLTLAYAGYGIWALAVGYLLARLFQCIFVWRASGWRPHITWPDHRSIELLRFSMPVSLSAFLWFINSGADAAIIAAALGTTALGFYSLAVQIITLPVEKLASSVNQIAYPVYCKFQDRPEKLREIYVRVLMLLLVVAAPMLFGLSLVADDAVTLALGTKWRDMIVPLQILAPAGVFLVIASTLPSLFQSLGRPNIYLAFSVARAIAFPLTCYVMVKWAGVVGVCIGWLLLIPASLAILFVTTRGVTGFSAGDVLKPMFPIVVASLAMAAAVLVVRSVLPLESDALLRLCLSIVVGGVSYFAGLVLVARHTLIAELMSMFQTLRGRNQPVDIEV